MLFGIRSIRIISHLGLCPIQYSVSWDCVVCVNVTWLTFLKNVIMSLSLMSVFHASLWLICHLLFPLWHLLCSTLHASFYFSHFLYLMCLLLHISDGVSCYTFRVSSGISHAVVLHMSKAYPWPPGWTRAGRRQCCVSHWPASPERRQRAAIGHCQASPTSNLAGYFSIQPSNFMMLFKKTL